MKTYKTVKPTIDKVVLGFTKKEAELLHRMLKFVVDKADRGDKIKVIDLMFYVDCNPDL